MKSSDRVYTDYPIVELGDIPNQCAPIREVKILNFDGDKYCTILVLEGNIITEVKGGYLYKVQKTLEQTSVNERFTYIEIIDYLEDREAVIIRTNQERKNKVRAEHRAAINAAKKLLKND